MIDIEPSIEDICHAWLDDTYRVLTLALYDDAIALLASLGELTPEMLRRKRKRFARKVRMARKRRRGYA